MESSKSKVKSWLKEPIFSKKIDPFLIFGLVVLSSIISSSLHQVKEMFTGEYMLWFTPCAILAILILKAIGKAWKKQKNAARCCLANFHFLLHKNDQKPLDAKGFFCLE